MLLPVSPQLPMAHSEADAHYTFSVMPPRYLDVNYHIGNRMKVIVTGWKPGLQKVSMTRLILDQSLLGLAESKACTDRLLDGGTVEITMLTRDAAEILASDLNSINAIAHVEDG